MAVGFSAETSYVSSFGPDAYGTLHLQLSADPDLQIGVLIIGGTQPGVLATGARSVLVVDRLIVRGEVLLGMLHDQGPTGGLRVHGDLDLDRMHAVAEIDWIARVGVRLEGGVDGPLRDSLTVQPRLALETWAGLRDPALRVEMGLLVAPGDTWWLRVSASAGGRDVMHMGPGATLAFGRLP
jgi:hypothetical protein